MPSKFTKGTMVNQQGSPLEWLGIAWQTTPFIHSVWLVRNHGKPCPQQVSQVKAQ